MRLYTRIDRFRFIKIHRRSGQIDNAATTITESAEKIDGKKLAEVATKFELPIAQRLGYLLDTFANHSITKYLYKWFSRQKTPFTKLIPRKTCVAAEKNQKWKLWINEKVEVDE